MATILPRLISRQFPGLKLNLLQARISETPEQYIRRTLFLSFILAIALSGISFLFTKNPFMFLLFPLVYLVSFFYFYNYATSKISKLKKEISKEVVFAGRFLIIEIESGVPIYQAFQNLSKNYDVVGKYFGEVIQKVDLGTPFEDALNEAVTLAPSNDLRRFFWQILNSLKTGSEVSEALNNVFDQIVREQQIDVKEYGRKLNPLAMFYMMMAVIIPSLGTIMLIVMSTFIGFNLDAVFFSILIFVNIVIQFMFVGVIKSQRPPVDL